MGMTKLRWYAATLAIIIGAGLVVLGAVTGEQWLNLVGVIFAGGGAVTAPTSKPRE